MAVAQHHGIPTRLLDWSLDPMVAAYFAAESPSDPGSDRIAVWVFDREAARRDVRLGLILMGGFFTTTGLHPGLALEGPIIVPYDINQNARAQRGVFTNHLTLRKEVDGVDSPPSRAPLDEALSCGMETDSSIAVQLVTLPAVEAPSVLRLLDRRRINGSTMFPGYYGAARAAAERARWAET
jgi:hypothetical protein